MVCRKDVWGPAAWTFLHCSTESAPTTDGDTFAADTRETMQNLVMATAAALPCPNCRAHFETQLRAAAERYGELLWTSKRTLRGFLIDAHNEVNRMNGKSVVAEKDVPRILNDQDTTDGAWRAVAIAALVILVFLGARMIIT